MNKTIIESEYDIHEVTDFFIASNCNFTTDVLELLAKRWKCQWGVYWSVDQLGNCLRAKSIWHTSIHAEKLRNDAALRPLNLNEGMAGQVWKFKNVVRSNNLDLDMSLPRSLFAYELGFKTGIWIPVMNEAKVYGVIELLSFESLPSDENFLAVANRLGLTLGRLLSQ